MLALWQPQIVWSNAVFKQGDRRIADLPVDLDLGGSRWTARATRPSIGEAATGTWRSTDAVRIPVGADVTLLELEPARATAGRRHRRAKTGPIGAQPRARTPSGRPVFGVAAVPEGDQSCRAIRT